MSDRFINSVHSESRREFADNGGKRAVRGLYLVVQPSGAKSWSFRYRSPIDGKPKKHTIGLYPTFGLAAAREQAQELRRTVSLGQDPGEARKAAKALAANTSREVGKLLDIFVERHVDKKKASTTRLMRNQIDAELRPAWGPRRIETISHSDVLEVLDRIVARGAPVQANRVFSLIRKFFTWCVVDRKLLERSPIQGMSRPADEASRDRVLSSDEIRWLWRAADSQGNFGVCIKLLLITGQRRMEIGAMSRAEVEVDPGGGARLRIPPARTKNGREHLVPLPAIAVELINSVPRIGTSDLVFTTNGEVVSSGWSKAKARLDLAMLAVAQQEASEAGRDVPTDLPAWTIHDLRRTCASGLARLRQPPHVIEALLNHASGQISGVAAVYNVYGYAEEKAHALEAWVRHLENVRAPTGGNVIPMTRGAL